MSSLGIFNKETKTYQKVAGTAEAAVVDAEMSDTSTNTVQNKVIKKYVDDHTVVDTSMSDSSTNAVQNKVIKSYVDNGLNTLKKSVSDGKTKVANAITDKGVETATDATFDVMAENISKIETGGGELHGATLAVSTSESTLFGQMVTLSLNGASVGSTVFADNGTCSFTDIQKAGTYSLYSTDGTDSNTITVDVTAENVINKTVILCEFYLTPDGETVTPVNDVAILLKCAEIKGKSYTTMDELLADEQAMGDITMSENAMKYLVRSTGFADAVCANETFMTLLGQSAYVYATVLNSDLWKQAIKASQYWTLVYASKTVTVYGGAYETITIDSYYGSFTTNADGSCSHIVPIDTITLTGSVSGQSFTRTVTNDTTDIYVMPESALYWYGNECTDVTGGWSFINKISGCDKDINKIIIPNNNQGYAPIVCSNNMITISNYSSLRLEYQLNAYTGTNNVVNLNTSKQQGSDIRTNQNDYTGKTELKNYTLITSLQNNEMAFVNVGTYLNGINIYEICLE